MSDISLHITVKEENGLLFKKCIRKLLESTFILQERDGKLYDFVSRESNWQDMSEYLRIIGFDLLVDDKAGVAMLIASEADIETVGLKLANLVTFTNLQYQLLLVLWKVYLENLGCNEGNFVTKGDLIDKIRDYGVLVVRTELNAAFKLFKKYSLINYSEEEEGEDMKIQLYPSLQFGWDLPQFKTVAGEYLKEDGESEKTAEDEKINEQQDIEPEDFEEEEE